MSDSPHLDRCAICNGTREEHNGGMKHMFTLNAGELVLPPKIETKTRREGPDAALVVVSRLIETLVDKDILTHEEGLACYNISPKKEPPSEVVNTYEDPVSPH